MGRRNRKRQWGGDNVDDEGEDDIDNFEREWMNKRCKVVAKNNNDDNGNIETTKPSSNKDNKISSSSSSSSKPSHNNNNKDDDIKSNSSNKTSDNDDNNNNNINNDDNKNNNKEKSKIEKLRLKKQLQKQRRKEKQAATAAAKEATNQKRKDAKEELEKQTKELREKKRKIQQLDNAATNNDIHNAITRNKNNTTTNTTNTNSKNGFQSLSKGILYQDLQIGRGPPIQHRKKIHVSYTLRSKSHTTGKLIDSSHNFGFRFGKGEVIQGWDIGLQGMRVGGIRRLIVPPNVGYGRNKDVGAGRGGDLFFEVEVLRVAP